MNVNLKTFVDYQLVHLFIALRQVYKYQDAKKIINREKFPKEKLFDFESSCLRCQVIKIFMSSFMYCVL